MAHVLTLYIGNKNYSSWSMRIGVLLAQMHIEHRAIKVRFDSFAPQSEFKKAINALNPTGTAPVLVDGTLVIWDSLAIAEYLAEQYPQPPLWPVDPAQRARARSLCATMHGGLQALRSNCPMNIEASLPNIGALAWRDNAALRAGLAFSALPMCCKKKTSGRFNSPTACKSRPVSKHQPMPTPK